MKKLYVKQIVPIKTPTDVIRNLYAYEGEPVTMGAAPTYADEAMTKIECDRRRRSFDDMFDLARTYFPDITEVELMKVLQELDMRVMYCCTIYKMVFMGPSSGLKYDAKDGGFIPAVNCFREYNGWGRIPWTEGTYTAEQLDEIWKQAQL